MDWSSVHTAPAYDLTVADLHTFYVAAGPEDVLVHNCNIRSLIHNDARLVREAERAGKSAQQGIDQLTAQLANGNLNPGIGSKNLFGNISYARHRDGARVFFRVTGNDQVEILAKAVKSNESRVISLLQEIYG